jgi:LuxR family maltose regulon positive regulatory protein
VNELIKDKEPEIQINAELSFFQGNFQYWMGDTEGSIKTLSQALSLYDQLPSHVRCNIQLVLAMAMQKNGAYDKIVPELKREINNTERNTGIDIGYLYGALTFTYLLSGKLRNAHDVAVMMQLHTKKARQDFLLNWSHYLQALAEIQLFQTEKALKHFEIISKKYFIVDTRAVFDSMAATALIQQFNNNSVEATRLITDAIDFANKIGDPQSLTIVRSAQARIALIKGDLQTATEWANTYNEPPSFAGMFFWQEVPFLTKAKILISTGTKDSLQHAEELLSLLYDIAVPTNLDIQLVEIDLLQSLVLFKTNQVEKSIEKMKAALLQAEEQGFLRPFVEVGDLALEPLEIMKERNVCVDFIQEVTSLIIKRASSVSNDLHKHAFIPSNSNDNEKVVLTNRELETLYLLAEGFRNKEIANKIYVSEGTVKKHVYNMGQKFNTSTRVELINKARDLGYIQTD